MQKGIHTTRSTKKQKLSASYRKTFPTALTQLFQHSIRSTTFGRHLFFPGEIGVLTGKYSNVMRLKEAFQ